MNSVTMSILPKTRMMRQSGTDRISMISLDVLTQCRSVTNVRTDRTVSVCSRLITSRCAFMNECRRAIGLLNYSRCVTHYTVYLD